MAVQNFIDPKTVQKDVGINDVALNEGFLDQAALFSYYAQKHADAERQEAKLKQRLELMEAQLDRRIRKEAVEAGDKITEKQIVSRIVCSQAYQDLKSDYIDAQQVSNVCKATVEAFRHRRDMLIQLGADQREEKKGQLRMSEGSSLSDRAKAALGGAKN